jgi:hypothetical protein
MRCGSQNFAAGKAQSSGRVYFRPDKVKFFALKTADLAVKGLMCLDCGNIELVGDIEKARSLVEGVSQ